MKNSVLAMVLLFVFADPALALNKCTGPDGKVSYQDTFCASNGESAKIGSGSGSGAAASATSATPGAQATTQDWKIKSAQADKRMAIQAAIERREPMIGMTLAELELAMGPPKRVNTHQNKSGTSIQRVYEHPGKTWYVYYDPDADRVQSLSTHDSQGGSRTPATCPSAQDIKNAETSASSITLSKDEKRDRAKQIREMRNCGK